jgi:hypothetical protein
MKKANISIPAALTLSMYFLMALFFAEPASAQLSATLSIRTPAPPQLSTWINDRTVVQLIVINRGSAALPNCRASFFIRNIENQNIIARSNDNSAAVPRFTIPAGMSTTTFFGRDLVSEQAIDYDQRLISTAVATNSIPEGNYEFCVKILDQTGRTLTEVPCRTFTVLIPDPPTIVSPADNAELLSQAPPTFVWTPVQFVGNVRYNLKIAPLFAGQNRRQAIESNPPLVNQSGIVGTSFFYNPSLPSFSLYAQAIGWVWQVQAVDTRGVPVTRNEGRSEIGAFKFKAPAPTAQRPPTQPPPPPPPLPTLVLTQPPLPKMSGLKGRITYEYFGDPKMQPNGNLPLKNTPIRLSLYRYAKNFSGPSGGEFQDYTGKYNEVGREDRPVYLKTLATTTTDANGNFSFLFVHTDSMGFKGKKAEKDYYNNTCTYDEYWAARIEVENPYYTSPTNYLIIQPGQFLDLTAPQPIKIQANPTAPSSQLVAKVRTFDLKLTVKARSGQDGSDVAFKGQPIPGAKVYVLRENKSIPTNLPKEGNTTGTQKFSSLALGKQAGSPSMADDFGKVLFDLNVVSTGQTDAKGDVTFKLVRNLSPNDSYIIWAQVDSTSALNYAFYAQRFTSRGMWLLSGNFMATTPEDKDAKWNDEYPDYSKCQRKMTLYGYPKQPSVAGVVYFAQNTNQPVADAQVDLFWIPLIPVQERTMTTGANGYFKFGNLDVTKGSGSNKYGVGQSLQLIRAVRVTRPGYKESTVAVNNGMSLKMGQNAWLGKILLEPKATVNGSVVDAETGQGVSATVTFQDGVAVQTTTKVMSANASASPISSGSVSLSPGGGSMGVGSVFVSGGSAQVSELFSAKAPTGNNIRVIVKPNNQNYFSPETLFVNISSNTVTLAPFKVYQKKRRIEIRVFEEVPSNQFKPKQPLKGIKVTITNLPQSVITDASGIARFEPFSNASPDYTVRLESTDDRDDRDFITKEVTFNDVFVESKTYIQREVYLPRGGRISGMVSLGRGRPVAGARVRLVSQSSSLPIETFTDAQGKYTLRKIPLGNMMEFRASKSQSQTVGTATTLTITSTPQTNINFVLREYNDMDITKLWGFPIEVDNLREQGQTVYLDGAFVSIPNNAQFKLIDSDSSLNFTNIPIEPIAGSDNGKGIPFSKPKNNQIIITDKNNFREVRVYDKFSAKVFDPSGLKVAPLENNSDVGTVRGHVYLKKSSFSLSSGSVDFGGVAQSDTAFRLLRPDKSGTERFVIPVLTANAKPAVNAPNGFNVSTGSGNTITYKLFGFDAESPVSESFLLGDTIKLKTKLHTAFTNITPKDMNLDIGTVTIKTNSVQTSVGKLPISLSLGEKWKIESSDWSLDAQNGFLLKSGAIKTGSVDIGFTGIKIEPTLLQTAGQAAYNFSALPVAGGLATLKVLQGSVAQLGYDSSQAKWSFTISKGANSYAAFIENLPNCSPSDVLQFQNLTLYSDGQSGFTLQSNHPNLTVYKVAHFKPAQANLYDNAIQLTGQVDYGIPTAPPMTTMLQFSKQNGNTVAQIQPVDYSFTPNAVTMVFASGAQTLDGNGYTAKGKIYELVEGKEGNKKMFEFNITLRKTPAGAITATLDDGQTFDFSGGNGKSRLKNLTGGLAVSSSTWEQFKFQGDVESDEGISGKIAFVVKGDMVTDIGNQQVSVKNIEVPFGQLSITYDFAHRRMQGSIVLDASVPNAYTLAGSADVRFDPQGWFFTAYGSVGLYNPNITFAVGIVFGKYPNISNISEIQSKFAASQWKPEVPAEMRQIPSAYNNLKGFYFLGEATNFLGVTLPQIDVNLDPVVSCSVSAYYGMALSLGMNFSGSTQFDIGAAAFLGVDASIGGSIGLLCAGGSLHAGINFYGVGYLNLTNKKWDIEGGSDLILSGKIYGGSVACDSDCEGVFCVRKSVSGSFNYGVMSFKLGTDGVKLKPPKKK